MTDCKNCKYTDEYCTSGECTSQSPRNGSQKGDLTEQWKKWQLEGFRWYYVKFKTGDIDICWLTEWSNDELGTGGQYFDGVEDEKVLEVLAPVPSYEEYLSLTYAKEEDEGIIAEYEAENAQLKELLKEWVQFEIEENPNDFTVMSERMSELANKTKEVLK